MMTNTMVVTTTNTVDVHDNNGQSGVDHSSSEEEYTERSGLLEAESHNTTENKCQGNDDDGDSYDSVESNTSAENEVTEDTLLIRIMENWYIPTITLCTYGFLKEMKPSEPFLTPFLNSSYKHLNERDLSDQVYPISTYAYFVFLFVVFLTTDYLRYKPLIIIESLAYLATRAILVWSDGIPMMQVMQVTYGLASATEIAYYSYIYAMVDIEHYQKVSSYSRAVTLFGRGVSGILGQALISSGTTNYLVLNYISFGTVSVAVIVSFFLPKAERHIFALDNNGFEDVHATNSTSCWSTWKFGMKRMYASFKSSYSNRQLLMWSIWWAFAMCGGLQVENYVMNLWSDILGSDTKDVYNGAVFASGTVLSGCVVALFSFIKIQWSVVGEMLIGVISMVEAFLLYTMACTSNIWVAYVSYVLFRISYSFIITVASFQIAVHVKMSAFALIFGWNTFIALALESLLTFVVTDKNGLDLDESDQFVTYGCYFAVIAVVFMVRPAILLCRRIIRLCCGASSVGAEELAVVQTAVIQAP